MVDLKDWLILVPGETERDPDGRVYTRLELHTQLRASREDAEAEARRLNGYYPGALVALVEGALEYLPGPVIGERQCRVCDAPEVSYDEAYWSVSGMGEVLCHGCRSWGAVTLLGDWE